MQAPECTLYPNARVIQIDVNEFVARTQYRGINFQSQKYRTPEEAIGQLRRRMAYVDNPLDIIVNLYDRPVEESDSVES